MPAGLTIVGDHGVTQIDSDQTNMALAATNALYVPPEGASIGLSGVNPLLFIRTISGPPVTVSMSGSVTAPVFTFTPNQADYPAPPQAAVIQWYLFDRMPNIEPPNGGLVLYREDGTVAYSSDQKLLKIVDVHALPGASSPSAYSHPAYTFGTSANLVAVCLASPRLWTDYMNGRFGIPMSILITGIWGDGIQTAAGAVSIVPMPMGGTDMVPPATGPTYIKSVGGPIICAEVSGY